jgi:hypothetical protein
MNFTDTVKRGKSKKKLAEVINSFTSKLDGK